ncbi:hypothetical protein MHUMG1_09109 [Metarhizium humberi]|uniref:Uncharacterized protein n=1 Tax=Metarhizium humberi TaxID=2596975 RepID=A0A9P8M3I9_9HYPO|nr:hypothetical protein MHUMG1_09109 [Metarhizium humberi]
MSLNSLVPQASTTIPRPSFSNSYNAVDSTMKVQNLAPLAAAIAPSLACLHSAGSVLFPSGGPVLQTAYIVDDGRSVCDSGRGHWVEGSQWRISCIGGYGMRIATDGVDVWYDTPHGSFRWQHTGARSDSAFAWDNWKFC